MSAKSETPKQHAERHPYFRRLDDDPIVDEVRITTIPRFKTSELSGNPWRGMNQRLSPPTGDCGDHYIAGYKAAVSAAASYIESMTWGRVFPAEPAPSTRDLVVFEAALGAAKRRVRLLSDAPVAEP